MAKFFLLLGILIMTLTGGCALWVVLSINDSWPDTLALLGIFSAGPFIIGLVIYLLAKNSLKQR